MYVKNVKRKEEKKEKGSVSILVLLDVCKEHLNAGANFSAASIVSILVLLDVCKEQ